MQLLKIVSRLLDHPDPQLWEHRDELLATVVQMQELAPRTATALLEFATALTAQDLLDAQENYTALFDRGRALSLLLFEHVHGESRDRGQAMVDLMGLYERAGFSISVRELPDYIPLFLEYLSTRPAEEIHEWLGDAGHILALLAERLKERQSAYAVLFDVLLEIGQIQVDTQSLRNTVKAEVRDDTPEAMDKVWEEEAQQFGGSDTSGGCPPAAGTPQLDGTVKWVDNKATAQRVAQG